MKLTNTIKLKEQITKIFWITVAWEIIGSFIFFIGYTTVLDLDCDLGGIHPIVFFKSTLFSGFLAGVIGGSCIVFAWEKWLRSKNYGTALAHMFLSYILVYVVVAIPAEVFFKAKALEFLSLI